MTPLPASARFLGYSGLIPFVLLGLLAWMGPVQTRPWALQALAAYGAVIVSFLGGIHWGLGFLLERQNSFHFAWGVLPSLLAWAALLLPAAAGLALLAGALALCYAVDRRAYARSGVPHWLALRLHLSSVAAVCCLVGAAAVFSRS